MVITLLPGFTIAAMAAGEGTGNPANGAFTLNASGVNIITNADQLAYVAQQVNADTYGWSSANYKIGNDINLTAYSNWTPIGNTNNPFDGIFDGGGHTISNLKINATGSWGYGLFGDINLGTVKNVGLIGANISVTSAANMLYVGGLVGNTDGNILNCYVTGTIVGTVNHDSAYVGGLAGRNYHGTVKNCFTTATVSVTGSGSYSVGGLAGRDVNGYISNCYWLSTAIATGVGSGSKTGTGNCYFTGTNTLAVEVSVGGTNTSSLLNALNAWLNNEAKTDLYTWVSSGSYPVYGPLWMPPTYTATVTVQKDWSLWSGSGKSLALYQNSTKKYDLTLSGSSATASALAGTYDVYDGTTDTGVDIVVSSGGGNTATVNYYTLSLANGTGTSSPSGGGTYLLGKSVAIGATVNTGYVWSKWTSSNTALLSDQTTKSTSITIPAGSITLTARATPIQYNITYTLNGDTASTTNPANYTVESASFTLNTPTRSGHSFLGWTGSNGTSAQISVSIPTGSTGDKTYTANWKADKPTSAPADSIVTSKTDTRITIATQAGYEYSVNGTDWYSGTGSYTFTGLDPNKAYNLVYRKAAVSTGDISLASDASDALSVSTKKASASVSPPSAPTIGTGADKPTSDSITVSTVEGNEYYISTSATADWSGTPNGYFKATADGTHKFGSLSPATKYYIHFRTAETDAAMPSNSGSVVQYTLPETPVASAVSINYGAETISFDNTYEVSTSANFTTTITSGGTITPGTTYYVRVKSASGVPASEAVTFTISGRPATPAAITAANITKTETAITISNTVVGQEYQVDGKWYTPVSGKVEVTGLAAGNNYSIVTRVKATANSFASLDSTALTVTTKTAPVGAPAQPAIGTDENKPTSNSITISTVEGNEYYISTSAAADWSGTPNGYFKATVDGTHKFGSLSPATKYYIHFRTAETDTAMPSLSGSVVQYTLPETPVASAVSINYGTETISFDNTYEVSTSANFTTTITSGGTITPGTTYYVRVKSASGVPASEAVTFTISGRPATPAAITAANITKTETAITISNTVVGQEYQVDGKWYTPVSGKVEVTGLNVGTEYSIVTRVKATANSFVSANSDALIVKTKTAPVALSDSDVTYSVKDGTITGLGSTYEYSLDNGSTWQTTPVTGVTFAEGNVIKVRTRETDDAMPSLPQTLGTIGTLKAAPSYAVDFSGEKTTDSVPVTVEYNTSSSTATTWTAGQGAALPLTPGTTYYFRDAATDAALAGNVQTLSVPARPSAPADTVVTIAAGSDASHTNLTLAATYEFLLAASVPGASESGTAGTGSATEVAAATGRNVYVRVKATASAFASDWTDCGTVLLGVDSITLTNVGYDVATGKLTGTTTNMEYSLDGSVWQDCTADNTTGLTFVAGTVKVRQKNKPTNEYIVGTIAPVESSTDPTLGSKTYNSVTLTAMTGYEYSKDGGTTWQDSNVFSGLSGSTEYSFVARIKATATTLPGTVSSALTVTTDSAPTVGGSTIVPTVKPDSTPADDESTIVPTGAPVIVDGKTVNIGTANTSGDTTTVTVDQSKLSTNIDSATSGSSVVVPVGETSTAVASLVVKNIEDMAAKGMTLTVQTGNVAYNLNTSAIDTATLTEAFPGADMSKVPFDVTIQNSSVSVDGETLVVSPVAFTVTATYNGITVSVDTFSAYIDRTIEVTAEQASKITTAVVVNSDGSVRHVPTNVVERDGKYYAIINSRTNSIYALIQNDVKFADAQGKWYEAAVNEMGSRKIVTGRSSSVFDGGASITRAEFTVILVRALGLPADGTSSFSDVPATAWYTGAIATASQYGLIQGKGKNCFDPNAAITRQEAMLILQRAAALTEFRGARVTLDGFSDADSIGSWAKDAVKWNVGSGLIQGSNGKLNPTANITRAESAAIILRLLQKAGLVDVRTKPR